MNDDEKRRLLLLGSTISRCNKMHLCAGWGIEWKWAGEAPTSFGALRSRMLFLFDGKWLQGKSWDEDVAPLLKDLRPKAKPAASPPR